MKDYTLHHGDNVELLSSKNRDKYGIKDIDLIYMDPPFFTQRDWGEYDDRWKSEEEYLDYMRDVIFRCFVVLKDTGSLYLHCDDKMNYKLRGILDWAFNEDCFQNEIVWHYGGTGASKHHFVRKHDTILFYSKTKNNTFNRLTVPTKKKSGRTGKYVKWMDTVWDINIPFQSMERSDVKYPTQKPFALLERIILASSNEGDTVMDPFCGSGTTGAVAVSHKRKFIGIDKNKKALEITKKRIDALHPRLI